MDRAFEIGNEDALWPVAGGPRVASPVLGAALALALGLVAALLA